MELLVAIILLGILSGMVMVAVNATQQHARQIATQGLVQRINGVIQTKWDEYRYRPLNVELDSTSSPFDPALTPPQLRPEEAGRVRLMMLRDLMRMEMPDRQSDLIVSWGNSGPTFRAPTVVEATVVRFGDPDGDGRATPVARGSSVLPWFTPTGAGIAPSQHLSYRARLRELANQGGTWSAEHQSAECLYMILSTTTVNGISALDVIAPASIADTDGDGMPEVVDSWENPISWVRWPAGSPDPVITGAAEDEFDIMAADWGYVRDDVADPYNLTPLVVSPGPDGALGIVTSEYPSTPYSVMQWPLGMTSSTSAYTDPYYFIDPYDRVGGDPLPGSVVANAATDDNISSFDL